MNPKVSIIVPVYNCEKYLQQCLDSIINQTLKEIEIIVIDDGSIDDSPKICDEYAGKYENIIVIHKKNARVSAARNDGIKLAKGEYIGFVDADDWIEPNMYNLLYNMAVKHDTDLVMCDFKKQYINSSKKITQPIRAGLYNKENIEIELFNKLIMYENIELPPTVSNWTFLLRKSFLLDNNIFYEEDIHYCEDSLFGTLAMYNANRFYYLKNEYLYNYRYNPMSTTSRYNEEKWIAYKKINDKLKEYFKKSKFDFSRQIKINMLYFELNMLGEVKKSSLTFSAKRKKCKEIMNDNQCKELFFNFKIPKISYKLKIIILLLKYRFCFIYSILFYMN